MVDDGYIFTDDGVSGAEFVKRPGLVRLLSLLTPRAPFQRLIMSEESRLGREQIETAYILKRILDAGVRVFFYEQQAVGGLISSERSGYYKVDGTWVGPDHRCRSALTYPAERQL